MKLLAILIFAFSWFKARTVTLHVLGNNGAMQTPPSLESSFGPAPETSQRPLEHVITGIVLVSDFQHQQLYKKNIDSLRCYTAQHGYELHVLTGEEVFAFDCDADRRQEDIFYFRKHCVVSKFLEKQPSNYVAVVIDADVVAASLGRGLEQWTRYGGDLQFYQRDMFHEFAAGNYIARNTQFTRDFLMEWYMMHATIPTGFHSADNGPLHLQILKTTRVEGYATCSNMYKDLNIDTDTDQTEEPYWNFVRCCKEALGPPRFWKNLHTDSGAEGSLVVWPRMNFFVADAMYMWYKANPDIGPAFHHGIKDTTLLEKYYKDLSSCVPNEGALLSPEQLGQGVLNLALSYPGYYPAGQRCKQCANECTKQFSCKPLDNDEEPKPIRLTDEAHKNEKPQDFNKVGLNTTSAWTWAWFLDFLRKTDGESSTFTANHKPVKTANINGKVIETHATRDNPQIALIVIADRTEMVRHEANLQSLRCYANYHDYDFVILSGAEDFATQCYGSQDPLLFDFSKPCLLAHYLESKVENYVAMVVGPDTVPASFNQGLEKWVDIDVDLHFYDSDLGMELNSANYIVRNTNPVREFLTKWSLLGQKDNKAFLSFPQRLNSAEANLHFMILQRIKAVSDNEACTQMYNAGKSKGSSEAVVFTNFVNCVQEVIEKTPPATQGQEYEEWADRHRVRDVGMLKGEQRIFFTNSLPLAIWPRLSFFVSDGDVLERKAAGNIGPALHRIPTDATVVSQVYFSNLDKCEPNPKVIIPQAQLVVIAQQKAQDNAKLFGISGITV